MLSPQVQERISAPPDVFYCDCNADCLDSFKLPTLIIEMLYADTGLMLLVGKHTSESAGEVVKSGKGWKVCKVIEKAVTLKTPPVEAER